MYNKSMQASTVICDFFRRLQHFYHTEVDEKYLHEN